MSNTFRIVNIDPLPDWIRGIYDSAFESADYQLLWAPALNDNEVAAALNGTAAIVTGKRRVTESIIRAAGPNLKLVQVVGRAPWIVDFSAARDAGVPVSCLPHRGAIAVAEHTIALMLGVMRKLVPGHLGTAGAEYQKLGTEPIRTSERVIAFNWLGFSDVQQIYGKTLGLVGLGDIGLEVARRARAFDMEILYTKRSPLPQEYAEKAGVRYVSMDELLSSSDVVSLHAPHSAETEALIDADALARMKESAVLVNTARGGLVDESALADALRSKKIAGAGLDVFLDEPLPAGHAFLELNNILFSPHLAGGTGGGQKGVVADVFANIERVRQGETPHHLETQ